MLTERIEPYWRNRALELSLTEGTEPYWRNWAYSTNWALLKELSLTEGTEPCWRNWALLKELSLTEGIEPYWRNWALLKEQSLLNELTVTERTGPYWRKWALRFWPFWSRPWLTARWGCSPLACHWCRNWCSEYHLECAPGARRNLNFHHTGLWKRISECRRGSHNAHMLLFCSSREFN